MSYWLFGRDYKADNRPQHPDDELLGVEILCLGAKFTKSTEDIELFLSEVGTVRVPLSEVDDNDIVFPSL
jgi:hypothetical protein